MCLLRSRFDQLPRRHVRRTQFLAAIRHYPHLPYRRKRRDAAVVPMGLTASSSTSAAALPTDGTRSAEVPRRKFSANFAGQLVRQSTTVSGTEHGSTAAVNGDTNLQLTANNLDVFLGFICYTSELCFPVHPSFPDVLNEEVSPHLSETQ